MNMLRKRAQKVKKYNNFIFHDYLHNVSLKIETSFKVFKPIMKTRKVNDKR